MTTLPSPSRARRRTSVGIAGALLAAGSALAVSGCASSPATTPTQAPAGPVTTRIDGPAGVYEVQTFDSDRAAEHTVAMAPDRVWAVLPAVYDSLRLAVNTMVSAERLVGVNNGRGTRRVGGESLSRFLSCGRAVTGVDNADAYDVTLTVLTRVRTGGEGSVLATVVQGTARAGAVSGAPVRCASNGRLEERIAALARVLAAR